MIEILAVMAVVGILLAIGANMLQGARSAGRLTQAMSAADAYATAADQFARDHGGRYPGAPGSADWPAGADAAKGPRSTVLGTARAQYYLRSVPEVVQGGTVTFGTGTTSVTYRVEGRGYAIVLKVPGRDDCAVRGGGANGTTPKTCVER
ncbi:MAG: hypothetical protein JWO69_506 [Thermoleophilia bacterium]|jgi:type II secretory pathway pseudopilin PulG|nr:hypothetical protein [Thermoleophilia bacterium]